MPMAKSRLTPINKLTPFGRQKRLLKEAYERVRSTNRVADERIAHLQGQVTRLTNEATRSAQVIADKDKAVAARDETIKQMERRIANVEAERDRIVRIIDQFTSIEVSQISTVTGNSPKELRRT